MASTPAISELLESLCQNLYRDFIGGTSEGFTHSDEPNAKLIKRCKCVAFEVLLKKSQNRIDNSSGKELDPSRALKLCLFEWRIELGLWKSWQSTTYRFSQLDCGGRKSQQQIESMEKTLELLQAEGGDDFENVPTILVLTNLINFKDRRNQRQQQPANIKPFPKRIRSSSCNRAVQSKTDMSIIQLPKVDDFMANRPRFNSMSGMNQSASSSQSSTSIAFPSLLSRSFHAPELIRGLSALLVTPNPPKNTTFYMAKNWQHLGETTPLPLAPQSSIPYQPLPHTLDKKEALLHLDTANTTTENRLEQFLVASEAIFLSHIKSLIIGIETDSFTFDDNRGVFRLASRITIDSVRSITMEHMLQEFIECGSCFKRLKMLVNRDCDRSKTMQHSYMFAVMCSSFDQYLETFRRSVIFVDDKSILQLSIRMAPLILQIRNLAKILSIHPEDEGKAIPKGSKFLGYLYKLATSVTQKEVSLLLVYVLTECCAMYFRNFEIWLYQGIINEACGDLFIGYVNTYRECTVFHFEKAFFIRTESIPGFLRGYEELVLLCGKYTNLLRTYKSTHSVFELTPPPISICLSFAQVEKLKVLCDQYIRDAREHCGPVIQAKEVYQKNIQNIYELSQLSKKRLQEHVQRWKDEQVATRAKLRSVAEREHTELMLQVEQKRERILAERRRDIQLDRENEAIRDKQELDALLRENVQRSARLERWAELEELANLQYSRAKEKIQTITNELKGADTLNQNQNLENTAQTTVQIEKTEMLDNSVGTIDDNSNSVPVTTSAVGVETISPEQLDVINSNPVNIQKTDAERNRDHMKASSICFGSLTVDTKPHDTDAVVCDNEKKGKNYNSDENMNLSPENTPQRTEISVKAMTDTPTSTKFSVRDNLSLELTESEPKQLQPTPMSITSDIMNESFGAEACDLNHSKNSSDEFLSADGSPMHSNKSMHSALSPLPQIRPMDINKSEAFVPPRQDIHCIPLSRKINRFAIKELSAPISPLTMAVVSNTPSIIPPPSEKPSENPRTTLNASELRDLNVTHLTNFLQKSFTLPLQAHFNVLNNEILKIFLSDFRIFTHFNSLRNYFLMMDSEFTTNIFAGLVEKLETVKRPSELVNSSVLHSILSNAMHSNFASLDKNADNLSFAITNVPNEWHRDSVDVFKPILLSYQVDWPLNLVLGGETIEHYGYIFQYLLKVRWVAWMLEQSYFKLKDTRKQSADQILKSQQFCHVQHIRHKLLCFINGLQSYMNTAALQSSWSIFCEELQQVKSLEDICRSHAKYLNRIGFLSMLTKKSHVFLAKLEDVFCLTIRFCSQLNMRNWRCDENHQYTHPKYSKIVQIEQDFHTLVRFIIHAGRKMCAKGYLVEIGEFINLINMNGWYDELKLGQHSNNA